MLAMCNKGINDHELNYTAYSFKYNVHCSMQRRNSSYQWIGTMYLLLTTCTGLLSVFFFLFTISEPIHHRKVFVKAVKTGKIFMLLPKLHGHDNTLKLFSNLKRHFLAFLFKLLISKKMFLFCTSPSVFNLLFML